ncbi:MAG: hypothetical protein ACRD0U_01765, partial [Acidimicrobiales bacterium]
AETSVGVTDSSVEGAVLATQAGAGPGGRSAGSPLPPPPCGFSWDHFDGVDLDGMLVLRADVTMTGHIVWRPARSGVRYPRSNIGEGAGRSYEVACVRDDDPRYYRVSRVVFVPARTPAELAQEAFDKGMLPVPVLDVSFSPLEGVDQLVGLETWVWIDRAGWDGDGANSGDRSIDLNALFVTLTLTVEPRRVEWRMGDGGTVACEGPDLAWSPDTDPAAFEQCGYTYLRSSVGETDLSFDGEAVVEWEAFWSANESAPTSLGSVTQTTPFSLRVAEAQALNTN